MENLHPEDPLELFLDAYLYLTIWAVVYPPQFAGVLPAIRARIEALEAMRSRLQLAALDRRAATALERLRDKTVDRLVALLAKETDLAFGGRDDPRYQLLFPLNPSEAMKGVGDKVQTNFVKEVLARLATGGDYAQFQGRGQAIEAAQAALEAATTYKNQKIQAENMIKAERDVLRTAASEEYRLFYHRLVIEFPREPELPEMFFMTFTNKKGKKEPAE